MRLELFRTADARARVRPYRVRQYPLAAVLNASLEVTGVTSPSRRAVEERTLRKGVGPATTGGSVQRERRNGMTRSEALGNVRRPDTRLPRLHRYQAHRKKILVELRGFEPLTP